MTFIFASTKVMPVDVSLDGGSVIMTLLFALIAVMKFIIAGLGCTSDEGSWIALGF